ncbi:MAG: hypothetical protein CMN30_06130 [Sandaracinus sp.]|nr:hypothetical protein [Sandaracinus sp.]
MASLPSPARIAVACDRFAAFFAEVRERFVEREDLITQIALALIAREHVLVTGPPGTGKSALVSAPLGRIVHEDTGSPSLFAKQFTESTVQTELIGPVDFRTLTETGRMEHFTDEGMLGAVHAFLDEVLDGRDMLLRSTLNILEERELKQGSKITRGLIECAVMTSNRYLAEVLEESRLTLLAFVDRIAFVGFVPRGFAHPERLDEVVARVLDRGDDLRRPLTVEDIDVLQAMVDQVVVPRAVLQAAIQLGRAFDERTAQLERADPTFSATRYFSTRAYIRIAELLRVLVVHDKATRAPDRELVATREDLGALRLALMLSGPRPDDIEDLLARESDPRERRQLELVRAELEIFRECLRAIPELPPEAAVSAVEEPASEPAKLEAHTPAPVDPLASAVASLAGDPTLATVLGVADAADDAERRGPTDPAAIRAARGRALAALGDVVAFNGLTAGIDEPGPGDGAAAWEGFLERHLGAFEAAVDLRERLLAAGVAGVELRELEARFAKGGLRLGEHLETLTELMTYDVGRGWEGASASAARLGAVADGLEPVVARLRPLEDRAAALGIPDARAARRTLGRRIAPLLEAAYADVREADRGRLVQEVRQVLEELGRLTLVEDLSRAQHLEWLAAALVRGDEPRPVPETHDLGAYRALRGPSRVPLAYALAELAGLLASAADEGWPGDLGALRAEVGRLDEERRATLADRDLGRLEALVAYLERWHRSGDEAVALAAVAFDERALLRSCLEVRLVADLLPVAQARADALEARFRALADVLLDSRGEARRAAMDALWGA